MEKKKQLGELIRQEIQRQGMSIIEFAEKVGCARGTIYYMFDKNDIGVLQLKRISKILNRNFFKEVAEDLDIVSEIEETMEQREKRIAITNFLEIVPECLKQLGKSAIIVLGRADFDTPVPDYCLTDAFISFIYGETFKKRLGDLYNENFMLIKKVEYKGATIECIHNLVYDSISINIEITNRTFDEWYEVLEFAYSEIARLKK